MNTNACKVLQTDFTAGSGNALQAAIATLLGVGLEDCPNFVQAPEGYEAAIQSWLSPRGWRMRKVTLEDGRIEREFGSPGDKCIVRGTSPRGEFGHVVVGQLLECELAENGFKIEFWHDPHPDSTMLKPPLVWAMVFEPLLTLVGHAAFRSFRNVWMLEELGIPYKHIEAKPRTDEAFASNPFGKIPSLKDGEFTMYESAAINTYLGDRFREQPGVPNLVPLAGTKERGRYEQLVCCIMAELDSQSLWIHRKHEALPKLLPNIFQSIPEAVAAAKVHFDNTLGILAAGLHQSGDYLLGTDFSAADILFVHCLNWAEAIDWLPPKGTSENIDHVLEYRIKCRDRDAFKRATAKK